MRNPTGLTTPGAASERTWRVYGPMVDDISVDQMKLCALEANQARHLGELCAQVLQDAATDRASGKNPDVGMAMLAMQTDVATALNLSLRVISRMMDLGHTLITLLPRTLRAWGEGMISRRHVEQIVHEVRNLTPDETCAVEAALLTVAEDNEPSAIARAAKRTISQLHTDVIRDLIIQGEVLPASPNHESVPGNTSLGRTRAGTRAGLGTGILAHVTLTVPALTLLGRDDQPAELSGYGPIDTKTAANLCAGATSFKRILTAPVTGITLAYDRTVYRPPADLRNNIRDRDQGCRFPGCNIPAQSCEVDHTINWEWGGPTHADNLACLCRRHHVLKHQSEWKVKQIRAGTLHWTSPTGHSHTTRPPQPQYHPKISRGVAQIPSTEHSTDPPPF